MCSVAMFVFFANRLHNVTYSVSVRSENWKINFFINLRLSFEYDSVGKVRDFYVSEVCERSIY